MSFVHLHVYSAYSLLESTLSVKEMVAGAKHRGYKALALTDRNVMYAAPAFYKECLAQGIKPIIGLTCDLMNEEETSSFPLLLLALNNQGYKNLMKISSAIQTRANEGLPDRWLKGYANGLVAISPGAEGQIEGLLEQGDDAGAAALVYKYKRIFGEGRFYLSLPRNKRSIWEKVKRLAEEAGVPFVAAGPVRYMDEGDILAYQGLTCLKDNIKLADMEDTEITKEDSMHLASIEEMVELYGAEPDALENAVRIARGCTVTMDFHQKLLPKYPVPDNRQADVYLAEICHRGLEKRYPDRSKQHEDRLNYELSVIAKMGFSDYFLIVWDFMNHAHKSGIMTGPGRGSAAGSIVSYCLGITNVDPIKNELLFERFLNPERITMPDIDIDFPDNRREEMIRYVAEKYGALHVAQIITFGTFGMKAALRDAGRVFGLNMKEIEQLSRTLPPGQGMTIRQALAESSRLRDWVKQAEHHQRIIDMAQKWEGLPRHTSIHAAGVVITDRPLTETIPIQAGHEGVYLTQFAMEYLEEIGLLKMDFLGLRNLTLLDQILRQIERSTGRRIHLSQLPLDDEKTYELLSKGRTSGIFQFESGGMQNVLQKLKPTAFGDLVAVNALYRPGPMDNIPAFIARKHGRETVSYPHPVLKDILEPTYGIIVYQEQIMQIASTMAGFSLGEADLLRRAVSKKKKDVLDQEREHFVRGAQSKGYDAKRANDVYDLIVRFANYGFPKSHAVAYSLIAYQLAYLKANYFLHFMAGIMTSVIGNEEKILQYVQELKSNGYEILPPSINKSHYPFTIEKGLGIRYSLAGIKGIGASVLREIVQARKNGPFLDLFDFCVRAPARIVNRKVLENLCYAGAFDEFSIDRASLLASIDVALEHVELVRPSNGDSSFFDADDEMIKPKYMMVDAMPSAVKLQKEKEVLGFYLSDHPLSGFRRKLTQAGALPIVKYRAGMSGYLGAFIQSVKTIRTKKGENMAFLTAGDETGEIECVAFPDVYRHHSSLLKEGNMLLLEGKSEERNGKRQFVIKTMYDLNEENEQLRSLFKSLYIRLTSDRQTAENLASIKKCLAGYRGSVKVYLHYEKEAKTIQLSKDNWVNPSPHLISSLEDIAGKGNVLLKED
ncbi:DNA polymerase III subunit alpha [Pradoshia sp.]|uniref:DNA polymerase III subunit alpha n=1 Tax=Pradoshia sp. TaxID=2651281 RepID=UPI003F006B78